MPSQLDLRELAIEREPAQTGLPRTRRHLVARYLLPSVLIGGFAAVAAWSMRDAMLPRTAVTVIPVHVSRAEIQQAGTPLFKAAGWVEPRPFHIAVAALESGVVDKLLVVEDQMIDAGEPVALLVDDDARLNLDACAADLKLRLSELKQAEAAFAAAQTRHQRPVHLEAQLAEAEARLVATQSQLDYLPYDLRTAEARVRFAEVDHQGKTEARDAVSGLALEQSRSELDVARALVDQLKRKDISLRAEIAALGQRRDALGEQLELKTEETRQLEEAEAQRESARARVEQAQVAMAAAQLRLDRMTVRAPVDGRIYQLWTSPGARLVHGMGHDDQHDGSTVVTMYQPEKLQIRVDVRFDDLPQVRVGQPTLVESPALSDPMEGEVLFLTSMADVQKNTLEVKIGIDAPPEVIKPDMLVDVTFLAPKTPESKTATHQADRLFVPKHLVRQGPDGAFVWVADQAASVARQTAITTGRRGSSHLIEVTAGLSVTSKLITSPQEGLGDGQRIRVTGEDPNLGTEESGIGGASSRQKEVSL